MTPTVLLEESDEVTVDGAGSRLPVTPVLRVDTAMVRDLFLGLQAALPDVALHFAVKANPAAPVLRALAALGCRWDVASPGEVDAVLAAGGRPEDLSYGNTIKKSADIGYAARRGVDTFTLDCAAELTKITAAAPGSTVLVRLATTGAGADWALGGKFGCPPAEAAALLAAAHRAGHRLGVAFHIGSQQRDPNAWDAPLALAAELRRGVRSDGAELAVVNIGGGLPAHLLTDAPPISAYGRAIDDAMHRHFGDDRPELMAEPGRHLVADAGVLETEVVLVSERAGTRWVNLDAGLFTGLVEAYGESILYRLQVLRDGEPLAGEVGETILAGPTCDSLDVLYQRHRYLLPLDLRPGDRLRFLSAGAYTATYSSVGFNGFPPLREEFGPLG
ncbi:type III PLP-dependent enzyme [Nakamurella sp. GG22]